jgi:uncharacterized protein YuzE
MEEETVEAVKILEKRDRLDWDYDEAADVLYLSIGRPRKALGLDIGQGVVVRYDQDEKKVVGLTILGVRSRLTKALKRNGDGLPVARRKSVKRSRT